LTSDEIQSVSAQLRACEENLLDPAIRRDPLRVEALLDVDFREFGSSGRVWARTQILDLLASDEYVARSIEGFKCEILASDIALVTYCATSADHQTVSLRSSLWTRTNKIWRMRFQQGTRVP
jgi:hypothetical protein